MYTYRFKGRRGTQLGLELSDDLIVMRTHSRTPLRAARLRPKTREAMRNLEPVARFHDAGVEILRQGAALRSRAARDQSLAVLRQDPDCRFAGRVLVDAKSKAPVVYTENLFVKFADDESGSACRKLLAEHGLAVKRELEYARNAYFVGATEGAGRKVFDIGNRLLSHDAVELCHPELARRMRRRAAFSQQWHLKKTTINGQLIDEHAHVEAAWALSHGEGIIIAVIDDGIDIDHEEFRGSYKIVAPRDTTRRSDDPRPGSRDDHGTCCAGVACANGLRGASGVAPRARLMPIRCVSALGSQAEADAFVWAAQHGADVISCSWGPLDNEGPAALPDSTRLAMDYAVTNGRNGKGCVILFAAGNGNESVDTDGYASYAKVMAVAACNDSGRRSSYSDHGRAIWCAFPSNDDYARTPGIWTTDRTGAAGDNSGDPSLGDAAGNYTNAFGGTSSACPGAAGTVALILERNAELRWDEVRDVIKRSCDKIDPEGGKYDADGHSRKYGYGRINAKKAVSMALPASNGYVAIHTAVKDVPIPDLKTAQISLAVPEKRKIKEIKVGVDLEHTYVGDLVVRLIPPKNGNGTQPVVLQDRAGGGATFIRRTFDTASTPLLKTLAGRPAIGTWVLEVEDQEKQDKGKIRKFSLEMVL